MPRDELFDLAINKALSYVKQLGIEPQNIPERELTKTLSIWYQKTRFAYRIPLNKIIASLGLYQGKGVWQGGEGGVWKEIGQQSNC